uniref:Uncharacterized protein n=1 Tax=Moniliophthora roreri TaxID=221103 RepID=A0A0W0GCP8_MONRR
MSHTSPYPAGASLAPNRVYPDEFTYDDPFTPTTYKLLYILNSKHYDDNLMCMMEQMEHQHHHTGMGTLMFLRRHRPLLDQAITRLNREAGLFARTLVEGDHPIVLNGPIMVLSLPNDIKNLPLYLVSLETGADGQPVPTDKNLNPNKPTFLLTI